MRLATRLTVMICLAGLAGACSSLEFRESMRLSIDLPEPLTPDEQTLAGRAVLELETAKQQRRSATISQAQIPHLLSVLKKGALARERLRILNGANSTH